MKKLIVAIVFLAGTTFTIQAQSSTEKSDSKSETTQTKDHACSSECTHETQASSHGEKGHTCSTACETTGSTTATMGTKDHTCTADCKEGAHGEKVGTSSTESRNASGSSAMATKDHTCTDACTAGDCVIAHGETGHTCTEDCKKKM